MAKKRKIFGNPNPIPKKEETPITPLKERPLNLIDKRMVIYNGNMVRITVNGITFDKGVPTFVAKLTGEELTATPDFSYYENGKTYSPGRPIQIKYPALIDDVLSLRNTVKRIKEVYPTCPVNVICRDEFIPFIPIPASFGHSGNQQYYRTFDYTNIEMSGVLINLHPRHEAILRESKFFEFGRDENCPPILFDVEKNGETVILNDNQEWRQGYSFAYQSIDPNDSQVKLKEFIKNKNVVALGHSSLAYLAAYSGANVLLVTDSTRSPGYQGHQYGLKGTIDWTKQYKCFPNVKIVPVPQSQQEKNSLKSHIEVMDA